MSKVAKLDSIVLRRGNNSVNGKTKQSRPIFPTPPTGSATFRQRLHMRARRSLGSRHQAHQRRRTTFDDSTQRFAPALVLDGEHPLVAGRTAPITSQQVPTCAVF